jgi:heme oxygenase
VEDLKEGSVNKVEPALVVDVFRDEDKHGVLLGRIQLFMPELEHIVRTGNLMSLLRSVMRQLKVYRQARSDLTNLFLFVQHRLDQEPVTRLELDDRLSVSGD